MNVPSQPAGVVPEISVVVPVFNSANIFPELHRRLAAVLDKERLSFELVAVVDGGSDNSYEVIRDLSRRDPRVKAVEFSRNFGHQAALTAGLALARGGLVAIMDDDLEDPPEVLPELVARARAGYDVVYGIRRKRKRSWLHRLLFAAFYRVLNSLVDVRMPGDAGDFCVMTRRVVATLNAMPEKNRYLRGLRAWTGFSQTGVPYERGRRLANESGYNLSGYCRLALDAVFAFSYKPLGFVSKAGLAIALLSFLAGIYLLFSGRTLVAPGWSSLIIAILFFSGVQLLSIGIIGQYLARIYDEIKQRPRYIIKRRSGFGEEDGPA